MSIKNILLLALCLLFGCKSKQTGGLSIDGQIKGAPSSAKIYLEEITYTTRTPVDTAEIDAQGNFHFNANVKELGLYQVHISDQQALFFVLDNNSASVKVTADSSSIQNFTYQVVGSPASDQLRKFIMQMKGYGEAFGNAMKEYQLTASDSSASDSLRNAFAYKVAIADSNFRQFTHAYLDTVKNPVIAIFVATNLDYKNDRAEFDKIEQWVRKDYPQLPFAQAFLSVVDQQKQSEQADYYSQKFAVGNEIPDVALSDVNGKTLKLSSFRGQIVLLDFWASWCGPCRRENPNVVSAYKKYHDKGFTIYSVSLDTDRDKWLNAIQHDQLLWKNHVSELKGWESSVCETFGIRSIPQNYLIDKDGKIIAANLRGEDLEQKLSEVLH